ncbi:MAG TPA: VIT1/CCC1 transporter family protein [Aggregatilineaceae bacterium]|nr:VIT1/CCC1 transporter family protein [Aggregatilineaceae bacterium]
MFTKVVDIDTHHYHTRHDPHRRASGLSDIILGGQDGLVNVLGVILGVAAATRDTRIVLVAGLAATIAESISMGAVAYTSTLADSDFYESERKREYRHIDTVPELERQEVYQIYHEKGFEGELLDDIVETITANPDIWVAVMMAEEHHLTPINRREAIRAAVVVGLSAVAGSLVPLLPFALLPVKLGIWTSIILAALVLFGVGAYKARVTVGHPGRSGVEMAIIGTVSAMAGYLVGLLLKVPM